MEAFPVNLLSFNTLCQFPKELGQAAKFPQSKVIHPPWLLKAEMKTEHWGQITGGWGSDLGVGVDAEVAQGMR